MLDRIMGLFALLVLAGFLFILGWKLQRIDLSVVIGVTLLLAFWDFFRPARKD